MAKIFSLIVANLGTREYFLSKAAALLQGAPREYFLSKATALLQGALARLLNAALKGVLLRALGVKTILGVRFAPRSERSSLIIHSA